LQEQPFQVLLMLLERPGELVTREELRQRLWPADTFVDFDHGLNTAVNKLRDVLGDSAANPKFIETLARRGYRFVGPAPVVSEDQRGPDTAERPSAIGRWPSAANENQPGLKPSGDTASSTGLKPGVSAEPDESLPTAPRTLVRTLFALVQVMYLCFYVVGLARLHEVYGLAAELIEGGGRGAETAVLITASAGIAVRLYLLTAVLFDYGPLGWKFQRIFPLVLVLDFVWALSPYLLMQWIGAGLATAACAALLYLPFSQRTLVRMAYGGSGHRA
jgi:DNA-binding winged helix-turn-helix (wHTH) protein